MNSEPNQKKTLVLAGGGSGGHVWPGVAIADAWKRSFGERGEILFVGARGGMEEKIVPTTGYSLRLLDLGSLKRVSFFRQLKTFIQLPFAFFNSFMILLVVRPTAVIGIGGYASGPLVLLASLLAKMGFGIRTAILEPNAVTGFTNRILGKFVHRIFSTYELNRESFPMKKFVVTGVPLRSTMEPLAHKRLGEGDAFVLFIFGGSQGALGLNSMVLEALPHLMDFQSKLQIIHQTGEIDFDRVKKAYDAVGGFRVEIDKFIFDMRSRYERSALVICRSGASTLSELAAVRRASILVPLPTAADNHQYVNARIFVDAGASLMAEQSKTTGKQLAEMIIQFIRDPEKLKAYSEKVADFYRPNAANDIVKELNT